MSFLSFARKITSKNTASFQRLLCHVQKTSIATSAPIKKSKALLWGVLGASGGAGLGLIWALEKKVNCGELELHPVALPWNHNGLFSALDVRSIRRGYQVFKEVCAACHGLRFIAYRHMVNTFLSEDEAKAEAAEIMVQDGPDDEGKMFERPGKLTDYLKSPYPNDKAAAYANNGAIPPDQSLMILARHGGEDYIFSLLTGYQECPGGVELAEGQAYNPYFHGGVISMPQQLFDGMLQYADGTPATQSQMAKDVSTFLVWASQPSFNWRKRATLKIMVFTALLFPVLIFWKRKIWTQVEGQQFLFQRLMGRGPPSSVLKSAKSSGKPQQTL